MTITVLNPDGPIVSSLTETAANLLGQHIREHGREYVRRGYEYVKRTVNDYSAVQRKGPGIFRKYYGKLRIKHKLFRRHNRRQKRNYEYVAGEFLKRFKP